MQWQNDLIVQFLKGSGPILQNQAISAKYLKNASVKAFNQPWTCGEKKSVEYSTV